MDKTSIRNQDQLAAGASTQPRQFFRASSRVFCLNGEWFFQTREDDHGPFTRREAAETALARYVAEMKEFGDATPSYPSVQTPARPPAHAADTTKQFSL